MGKKYNWPKVYVDHLIRKQIAGRFRPIILQSYIHTKG